MLDLLSNAPGLATNSPALRPPSDENRALQYRELIEGLPAAVYTTDREGRIAFFNDAARELWGRTPSSDDRYWVGKALLNAVGAPLPEDRCPLRKVLMGFPAAHNAELVIERSDGSRRHVLANPRPIHDAAGRVRGAYNTLFDITDRKQAEAELAATKDELAMQVETLTRLHELAMRLGGITDMHLAIKVILDTAVEAQGADFGLVWLQDAGSSDLVVHASRGFDDERAFLFERIPSGPEGGAAGNAFHEKRRWVIEDTEADESFAAYREAARRAGFRAVHSTPIVTRSGALLGALSVHFRKPCKTTHRDRQVADVCARHAADAIETIRNQEALRESERLYRAIGESIDHGVWVCDAEGRNTYMSEAFLRLIGLTQRQCAGFGWWQVVHPEDAPRTRAAWDRCVATGDAFDVEQRVRGADGEWHAILSRGVAVRDARGVVIAWAGINLDIDRLKRVENDLRQLDQRKDEFLATLAHELRNPLAPLRNGLELVRLANGDLKAVEKARGMMQRQLSQLVRLVDDLLDMSRVNRGKIQVKRERVALAAVLRNAIETCQPLMEERGHRFSVELPPERIVVEADLARLSQVFGNLLNNAAKYTDPGGKVRLAARFEADVVEVVVEDNGIGIPVEMQSCIFEIFTQVDRAPQQAQGGLGIGLSIARRLVEKHGGSIHVRSDGVGKGSAFVVRMPAFASPDAEPASLAAVAVVGRGQRHRVLVVDADPQSAEAAAQILEAMGNEVSCAAGASQASELARAFRPDVVMMAASPEGVEACRSIRSQPWATDVYMVALDAADGSDVPAPAFDCRLAKPLDPFTLERALRRNPGEASR